MGPTRRFLALAFQSSLAARSGGADISLFSDDVSTRAALTGGRWTRPDLACLSIYRGRFVPYLRADLHTFEVKTASGLDGTSIHEAHAHGRYGQYAWLVFQSLGRSAVNGALYAQTEQQAVTLGVGLISFEDEDTPHAWRIAHWPRRTGTDHGMADAFIAERFSDPVKAQIRDRLQSLGWGTNA